FALNQPVSWMFLMSIRSSVASCSSSVDEWVYWNGTCRGWSQMRATTASDRLDRIAARIAPATSDRPGRSIVTRSHIDSPGSLGPKVRVLRAQAPLASIAFVHGRQVGAADPTLNREGPGDGRG